MKIINVEIRNRKKKIHQSRNKNSLEMKFCTLWFTFICLVSQFNTLELFCLQFNSILFHCIYYTSWESIAWETFQKRIVLFVVYLSIFCNRQDKGKCCIVLSFISPLLSLFCAFFLFIYYLCVRHRWSMKFSCLFFLYVNCKVKVLIFLLSVTREDFFVKNKWEIKDVLLKYIFFYVGCDLKWNRR